MRHQVTLFGKVDCHLCHEAEDLLRLLQREIDFDLTLVDIHSDAELFKRYRYTIPVVMIDEVVELEAPVMERELRAALK